jgi:hypothetical protein
MTLERYHMVAAAAAFLVAFDGVALASSLSTFVVDLVT